MLARSPRLRQKDMGECAKSSRMFLVINWYLK